MQAVDSIEDNGKLVAFVVLVDGYHCVIASFELEKEGTKWPHIFAGLNIAPQE